MNLDVFVGSTLKHLEEERDTLLSFVYELNMSLRNVVDINVVITEDDTSLHTTLPTKDVINKALEDTSVAFFVVKVDFDQLSKQEFELALERFKQMSRPRITVIFYDEVNHTFSTAATEFQNLLSNDLKYYYEKYQNSDQLKFRLLFELVINEPDLKLSMDRGSLQVNDIEVLNQENAEFYTNHELLNELKNEESKILESLKKEDSFTMRQDLMKISKEIAQTEQLIIDTYYNLFLAYGDHNGSPLLELAMQYINQGDVEKANEILSKEAVLQDVENSANVFRTQMNYATTSFESKFAILQTTINLRLQTVSSDDDLEIDDLYQTGLDYEDEFGLEPKLHLSYCQFLFDKMNYQKAIDVANNASDLLYKRMPKFYEYKQALLLLISKSYYTLNQLKSAETYTQELMSLERTNKLDKDFLDQAKLLTAMIYSKTQRIEKAVELLDSLYHDENILDETYLLILDQLAIFYVEMVQIDKAREAINKAILMYDKLYKDEKKYRIDFIELKIAEAKARTFNMDPEEIDYLYDDVLHYIHLLLDYNYEKYSYLELDLVFFKVISCVMDEDLETAYFEYLRVQKIGESLLLTKPHLVETRLFDFYFSIFNVFTTHQVEGFDRQHAINRLEYLLSMLENKEGIIYKPKQAILLIVKGNSGLYSDEDSFNYILEAINIFKMFFKDMPKMYTLQYSSAILSLAITYGLMGDFEKTIEYYDEVVQNFLMNDSFVNSMQYFNITTLLLNQRKYKELIHVCEITFKVLEENPFESISLSMLSMNMTYHYFISLYKTGAYDKAYIVANHLEDLVIKYGYDMTIPYYKTLTPEELEFSQEEYQEFITMDLEAYTDYLINDIDEYVSVFDSVEMAFNGPNFFYFYGYLLANLKSNYDGALFNYLVALKLKMESSTKELDYLLFSYKIYKEIIDVKLNKQLDYSEAINYIDMFEEELLYDLDNVNHFPFVVTINTLYLYKAKALIELENYTFARIYLGQALYFFHSIIQKNSYGKQLSLINQLKTSLLSKDLDNKQIHSRYLSKTDFLAFRNRSNRLTPRKVYMSGSTDICNHFDFSMDYSAKAFNAVLNSFGNEFIVEVIKSKLVVRDFLVTTNSRRLRKYDLDDIIKKTPIILGKSEIVIFIWDGTFKDFNDTELLLVNEEMKKRNSLNCYFLVSDLIDSKQSDLLKEKANALLHQAIWGRYHDVESLYNKLNEIYNKAFFNYEYTCKEGKSYLSGKMVPTRRRVK